MKYFAYGSNMLTKRLDKRIPNTVFDIGKLTDYVLTFNKISTDCSGKANIKYEKGMSAWGVIFEISEEGMKKLDSIEKGYERKEVAVLNKEGIEIICQTYISSLTNDALLPKSKYLNYLINGAVEHKLPQTYIDILISQKTIN